MWHLRSSSTTDDSGNTLSEVRDFYIDQGTNDLVRYTRTSTDLFSDGGITTQWDTYGFEVQQAGNREAAENRVGLRSKSNLR